MKTSLSHLHASLLSVGSMFEISFKATDFQIEQGYFLTRDFPTPNLGLNMGPCPIKK